MRTVFDYNKVLLNETFDLKVNIFSVKERLEDCCKGLTVTNDL